MTPSSASGWPSRIFQACPWKIHPFRLPRLFWQCLLQQILLRRILRRFRLVPDPEAPSASSSWQAFLPSLQALHPALPAFLLPFPPIWPFPHPALPGSAPASPLPFPRRHGASPPGWPGGGEAPAPAWPAFSVPSFLCGSADVHMHPAYHNPHSNHPCLARFLPPLCAAA